MGSSQTLTVGGFFPVRMKLYGADLEGLPMEDGAPFGIVGEDGKRWTIRPCLPLVTASRRRTAREREEWIDERNRHIVKSFFSADRQQLCSRIACEIHDAMRDDMTKAPDRERVKALSAIQNRLLCEKEIDMAGVRSDLRALGVSVRVELVGGKR